MTDPSATASPPVGKGRPTPKRSDSRRRHTGPVAPPPQTRKEAVQRQRQARAEARKQGKGSPRVREQRHLLGRDAGPVRAFVRDLVDSRRHISSLLLPAALLPVAGQATQNLQIMGVTTTLWIAALMGAVVDFVTTAMVVRKRVRAEFPAEVKTGRHIGYALIRTAQFKRFRLPPPVVKVGDKV